jgi:hypothetical protein
MTETKLEEAEPDAKITSPPGGQGHEITSPQAGEGGPQGRMGRPNEQPPLPPSSPPSTSPPGRRLWTAALAAALLVTAGGLGLLYVDDTGYQNSAKNLTSQNESLTGRNQILSDQLNTTEANLTATLGELATTQKELANPHLTIWNVPETLKGQNWYLAGGIPDTFIYHLMATSTGPMSVSILRLEDFASARACVANGYGPTDYCMHHSGAYKSWFNITSISYDFYLAEGCADYVAVFTSANTIKVTPNVSVDYKPASAPTGACVS